MELSEYLLSGHRHLYKNQTRGTCTDLKSTQRNLNIRNRRQKRDNILFNNRNIDSALSPITPATQKKTPREKQVYKMDECAERLRQLAKWKEEKEKMKKLNRKNSKPVFKVSRVTPPVGLPDLELVNKQIKGKVFTTVQKPTLPDLQTKQPKMPAKTPTKIPKSTNKTPVRKQNAVTAPKSTNKTPVQKQETKPDSKLTKKTPLRKQNLEKSTNKTPVQKQNTELTPAQVDDRPRTPPYLSPYVTVSRGKKNARYEHEIRTGSKEYDPNVISEDMLRLTSPQACANYFEYRLNKEIKRLESECQVWEEIRESNEVPEDANDMIDVAIGQTKLLISQKFQQFRNLIKECRRNKLSGMPVKNEDLHGFWDMIFIQVNQLDERFKNLDRIKNNNWEEILPERKIVKKVQKPRASKVKASSKLKNMIKERKKTMARNNEDNIIMNNSLTIMNLSTSIKHNNGLTPSKRNVGKTPKSAKKTVCFQDDMDNKENKVQLDIFDNEKNILTPRRSLRLIRKSLRGDF